MICLFVQHNIDGWKMMNKKVNMTQQQQLSSRQTRLHTTNMRLLPFFTSLFLLIIEPPLSTDAAGYYNKNNLRGRINQVQIDNPTTRSSGSEYSSQQPHLLQQRNLYHKETIMQNRSMQEAGVNFPTLFPSEQNLPYLQQQETKIRSAQGNDINGSTTILLTRSTRFQAIISTLLSILIFLQLLLFSTFVRNRNKRVMEFAQPIAISIFVACSIVTTSSCFFYIYVTSSFLCAIREPIVFMSISSIGAIVSGRAWRISTLLNNPLLLVGNGSDDRIVPRIEHARQSALRILGIVASRREKTGARRTSSFRVPKITSMQMSKATIFMILPQLLWQTLIMSIGVLRSSRELIPFNYTFNDHQMLTMEQYQCQSRTGFWTNYVSILLTLFPYAIAFLLNLRPKSELDVMPEIIDERKSLERSFYSFVKVLVVTVPMIELAYFNPEAQAYGAICTILALPLMCCYHIAYVKLDSTRSNTPKQQLRRMSNRNHSGFSAEDDADRRSSTADAVRMAEMFYRIGRATETVQLVDETLCFFQKSHTGGNVGSFSLQSDGRHEVASGFTTTDLKNLDEDELQLIIHLLRLKGNALIKLDAKTGFAMSAKLNIDALKLFETAPVTKKMKDISFMFPVYNMVVIQMKGNVIEQDDKFTLEMELASRFCREAQLHAYHYARSLANVAEMYGRVGLPDEAFKYFKIMKSVYMVEDHPKLLLDAYSVDRCAVSFATSALWYLQKGQIDDALDRCDYVIDQILPRYNAEDIFGVYQIIVQITRVLKWNGRVDTAREAYKKFMPDSADSHFIVGSIYKPMYLLLQICDGSTHEYDESNISEDIELVLSFDVIDIDDHIFTCDGWSTKSVGAELCMLLARRLDAGNESRERLIERGIMLAAVAQRRVQASDGMVKHILAYEANKDIQKKLLELANEDAAICRHDIRNPSVALCSTINQIDIQNSKASQAFANKFSLKVGAPTTLTNGIASDSSESISKISHLISSKKKVSFANSISIGSNSSFAKRLSLKSRESGNGSFTHSNGPSESVIESEG